MKKQQQPIAYQFCPLVDWLIGWLANSCAFCIVVGAALLLQLNRKLVLYILILYMSCPFSRLCSQNKSIAKLMVFKERHNGHTRERTRLLIPRKFLYVVRLSVKLPRHLTIDYQYVQYNYLLENTPQIAVFNGFLSCRLLFFPLHFGSGFAHEHKNCN